MPNKKYTDKKTEIADKAKEWVVAYLDVAKDIMKDCYGKGWEGWDMVYQEKDTIEIAKMLQRELNRSRD